MFRTTSILARAAVVAAFASASKPEATRLLALLSPVRADIVGQ